MADSQKKTAIDRLATICNTSSVNSVVVSNGPLDLSLYSSSQLPLVQIVGGEEVPRYEVSRHALWSFDVEITVFYLADDDEADTTEALIKELKDALGADITLSGTCAESYIRSIRRGGEWPLWEFTILLDVSYEKEISNA